MKRTRWNTALVSEEMKKENCLLLSEYKKGDLRIEYEYEGNVYSVRWSDWLKKDRPSRPHLKGGNRSTKEHEKWNNEKVNELLKKDNCELADEYHSTKQRFRYKYNNSFYTTTLDDWIHHKSRPHLYIIEFEQKLREYLEKNHIEFETQKSFDDLKSKKNYVLRFDFYIPEKDILIELDDRGHFTSDERREHDKNKDEYCIRNKKKLIRLDDTTNEEDFEKIFSSNFEENIYIIRLGKRYALID